MKSFNNGFHNYRSIFTAPESKHEMSLSDQRSNQPEQPTIPLGRFPYGWDGVAVTQQKRDEHTGLLMVDKDGKPVIETLPFPRVYRKQFTHVPRTVLLGAPKRGGFWAKFKLSEPPGFAEMSKDEQNKATKHFRRCLTRMSQCKPTRYIVWHDRSLRRIDKVLKKQFSKLSPDEQQRLIAEAAALPIEKEAAL